MKFNLNDAMVNGLKELGYDDKSAQKVYDDVINVRKAVRTRMYEEMKYKTVKFVFHDVILIGTVQEVRISEDKGVEMQISFAGTTAFIPLKDIRF